MRSHVFISSLGLATLAALATPLQAQVRLHSVPGGGFWTLSSAIGDADGDGVSDFALIPDGEGGRVYSGANGTLISTFSALHAGSVSGAGDVDADGDLDLIVGTPYVTNTGYVEVFDALTGTLLMHIDGMSGVADAFGISVAGLGDVDGDGHDDFAIGAMSTQTPDSNHPGRVQVHSGADGHIIHSSSGSHLSNEALGRFLAPMGDLNGDGVTDVLVGGYFRTQIRSGATWQVLLNKYVGASEFAGGEDLNGDGFADWIAAHKNQSRLEAFSGVDGSQLWVASGTDKIDMIGDVDGDGRSEFVTGDWDIEFPYHHAGVVAGRSGLDASPVFRMFGTQANELFGASVHRIGDTDGDGIPEFLAADIERTWVVSSVTHCQIPPTSTCPGLANSAFPGGCQLQLNGSGKIGANQFTLFASHAVPGQAGLFFTGPSGQQIPFGNGLLCISSPFIRLGVVVVTASGVSAGDAALTLDLSSPGSPFQAGDDWHFQLWYRDPPAGGAGFNLSAGLAVTFCQ